MPTFNSSARRGYQPRDKVARRRDLVLDDAQSVFPDELAEGPLDVEVRVSDAARQGPLEALAVEFAAGAARPS